MALNSCCSRQIDCALCPKTSQGVLIYSQYPKGQHFPAEKCTQNCIIFILKGELLVNSEEYPGTTLQARQCILQAIGSKVELLALTDVEYFTYRFTELPLLCEERYKDILERAYAPLTYTPLPIIPKLERLFGDLTEYFREQPNTCSRYLDVKCQEIIYILTCYYPIQQVSSFFYPISTRYGFDSLSHFAHFCKDSFGDTPRALRKRTANGENITIICKEHNKEQEDE